MSEQSSEIEELSVEVEDKQELIGKLKVRVIIIITPPPPTRLSRKMPTSPPSRRNFPDGRD